MLQRCQDMFAVDAWGAAWGNDIDVMCDMGQKWELLGAVWGSGVWRGYGLRLNLRSEARRVVGERDLMGQALEHEVAQLVRGEVRVLNKLTLHYYFPYCHIDIVHYCLGYNCIIIQLCNNITQAGQRVIIMIILYQHIMV